MIIRKPHRNDTNQRIRVGERVALRRRGKRGIYVMDFHWHGHRSKSTYTANLRLARRRALQLESQLLEGTYNPKSVSKRKEVKMTVRTFTETKELFKKFHESEGTTRRKTLVRYMGILKGFGEFIGPAKMDEIDLPVVDRFRASRKPHLSLTTMHHEASLLKAFFKWCVERKYMSENPLESRKFSQPKSAKKDVLTLEMVNAILIVATAMRFPAFAVLAFAGLRSGECRNLRSEDVDLVNRWIYIRSRSGYETKTGEEWKVPIHPRLYEVLSSLPASKSGWFFTALPSNRYPHGGHHINPKKLNEDFLQALKKCGFPMGRKGGGFTIHSLRHFFKTYCIIHRIPKPVVDEWQGHAQPKEASNDYFHLSDDDSQRLMNEVPFGENPPRDKNV